jgi:hypothetical protein
MKSSELYVISNRITQSLRLNDKVYSTFEEAKADLDYWEKHLDPERERYDRSEEVRAQMRSWSTSKPKNHNNRKFEVISLEDHIYNVAHSNYEKALRDKENYRGCFNTLKKTI